MTVPISVGGQSCNVIQPVNAPVPQGPVVSALKCRESFDIGTLTQGVFAAEAFTFTYIPYTYTGVNGVTYNMGQPIASRGVLGLNAKLQPGTLINGNGSLASFAYTVTGIPQTSGIAYFDINFGGQTCTFTRTVNAGIYLYKYG